MGTTLNFGWPRPTLTDPADIEQVGLALDGIDADLGAVGTVQTYTPAWTQSDNSALAIGNGTIEGRYVKVGRLVYVNVMLTRGSTTNVGTSQYRFSLPVQAVSYRTISGTGVVYGSATAYCHLFPVNGTTVQLQRSNDGAGIGSATPGSWAAGHVIAFSATYPALT